MELNTLIERISNTQTQRIPLRDPSIKRPTYKKGKNGVYFKQIMKEINELPLGSKRGRGRPAKYSREDRDERDNFKSKVGLLRNDQNYYKRKRYVANPERVTRARVRQDQEGADGATFQSQVENPHNDIQSDVEEVEDDPSTMYETPNDNEIYLPLEENLAQQKKEPLCSELLRDRFENLSTKEITNIISSGYLDKEKSYHDILEIDAMTYEANLEWIDLLRTNDVYIVKNLWQKYKMNPKLFSSESLCHQHGEVQVVKMEQEVLKDSKKRKTWERECTKDEDELISINECVFYQSQNHDAESKIMFGTNIDIPKDSSSFRELEKLPEVIQPKKGFLSFYEMPGISIPQIYLKIARNFTTVHWENNFLVSINCNVGESSVTWYAVPANFNEAFVSLAKRKGVKNMCTLEQEPHWPNLDDLLKDNIPVIKFIQAPGDTVLVGYGVAHWVVSHGVTNHVSWNLGPACVAQLEAILHKQKINSSLGVTSMINGLGLCWKILMVRSFTEDVMKQAQKICSDSFMRYLIYKKWMDSNGFIAQQELKIEKLTTTNDCNGCAKEMEHFQFCDPNVPMYELCVACGEKRLATISHWTVTQTLAESHMIMLLNHK